MTGWHGEQWDFQNNEKTMEHSDHWIMTGWHGEQWDFQNNEKTMEHSDHWIVTIELQNDSCRALTTSPRILGLCLFISDKTVSNSLKLRPF
jgi:hypothetical protein